MNETAEPVRLRMRRHIDGTVPVWGVRCAGCNRPMERTHDAMRHARKRSAERGEGLLFWCPTCHNRRNAAVAR